MRVMGKLGEVTGYLKEDISIVLASTIKLR